jgi:DNA ligase D-like protein (predicted 3'-phosphoesterase)
MISLTEIFKGNKHKNKFLIHEHHADRVGLHYDIRIEHNGKLESWACRYVPDLIKGNKKKILIILQPAHELDWFDFEGQIEDGYGKGRVKIWDKGNVNKIKWEDNHKTIEFSGTKLKGIYHIIRYTGGKRTQFLMFRAKEQS